MEQVQQQVPTRQHRSVLPGRQSLRRPSADRSPRSLVPSTPPRPTQGGTRGAVPSFSVTGCCILGSIIPPLGNAPLGNARPCARLTTRLLCARREELEALDLTELAAVRPASDAVLSPRLWQKLEREVLIEVRSQVCDMAVHYPSRFCLGS